MLDTSMNLAQSHKHLFFVIYNWEGGIYLIN